MQGSQGPRRIQFTIMGKIWQISILLLSAWMYEAIRPLKTKQLLTILKDVIERESSQKWYFSSSLLRGVVPVTSLADSVVGDVASSPELAFKRIFFDTVVFAPREH